MEVIQYDSKAIAKKTKIDQFLVAPPTGAAFENEGVLKRINAHMKKRFPHLNIKVSPKVPMRQPDGFAIFPIAGYAGGGEGDPDEIKMLPIPSEETMDAIRAALEDFDPYRMPEVMN